MKEAPSDDSIDVIERADRWARVELHMGKGRVELSQSYCLDSYTTL